MPDNINEELEKAEAEIKLAEAEQRLAELGLLQKIKNFLLQYYEPTADIREAAFHFTTEEITRQLYKIYPNELLFSATDVAAWLHAGGFVFYDFGDMRFEWLIKRSK